MDVVIFCLLVLFLVILLVHLFLWWREQVRHPNGAKVCHIRPDELKVGDMLLMTTSRKTWRFGWWKHVALVIKDEKGRLCIADFSTNGLVIEPCELFIRTDAKRTIYGLKRRLIDATEKQSEALRNAVHQHRHTSFNQLWVLRWICKRLFNYSFDAKAENCVSFVIDCLQKATLLPAHINRHVATLYECATSQNLGYGPELLIIFKKEIEG